MTENQEVIADQTSTASAVEKTVEETAAAFFGKSPEVKETVLEKKEETPAVESKTEEKPSEPVDYELEIKEGFEVSKEDIDEVKSLAVEAKLSKEQAQKFLDSKSKAVQSFKQKQEQEFSQLRSQWIEQVQNDKELGGTNFESTKLYAKRALDEIASPELKKILDATGYGNHPELVRAFSRLGKKISNDKIVQAPKSKASATSFEEMFYGKNE